MLADGATAARLARAPRRAVLADGAAAARPAPAPHRAVLADGAAAARLTLAPPAAVLAVPPIPRPGTDHFRLYLDLGAGICRDDNTFNPCGSVRTVAIASAQDPRGLA